MRSSVRTKQPGIGQIAKPSTDCSSFLNQITLDVRYVSIKVIWLFNQFLYCIIAGIYALNIPVLGNHLIRHVYSCVAASRVITARVYDSREQVVLEEQPRRVLQPPPTGSPAAPPPATATTQSNPFYEEKRKPGLTELTSIELVGVDANLQRDKNIPGATLAMDIGNVNILDLQGCVEHRNVLVANCSPDCRVRIEYQLSQDLAVPAVLKVAVYNPHITWLRRYSNNLLYAVGILKAAFESAVQQGASAAAPPRHQPGVHCPEDIRSSNAFASTPRKLPPVLLVKVSIVHVV